MTGVGAALLSRMFQGPERGPVLDGDVGAAAVQPGEGQLLYGLVRALRPETVLEIGAGHGYSTLHLAAGCRDNGRGFVYAVEPDSGRLASAAKSLADAGLTQWAVVMDLPDKPDIIDLAFIDAVHIGAAVAGYLAYIVPRLAPCGVVVIHDALLNDCVHKALDIGAYNGRFERVILPGTSRYGLAILRARP